MTIASDTTTENSDLDGRLAFLEIDEATREALGRIRPLLQREVPIALDSFYAKVKETPATAAFFSGTGRMDRAKKAQVSHWDAISAARFENTASSSAGTPAISACPFTIGSNVTPYRYVSWARSTDW